MRLFLGMMIVLLAGLNAPAFAQRLKPGDALDISVFQDSKLDRRVIIDQSGQIAFPLAGRVRAAGRTEADIENDLKERLKKNYQGEAVDVTVSLAALAKPEPVQPVEEDLKPRIFVTGEVQRPGAISVRRNTTLMQAIAMAGGLGPYAARSRVQVFRRVKGQETKMVFDYRAFESGEDLSRNIELRAGDVVVVPERGLFE